MVALKLIIARLLFQVSTAKSPLAGSFSTAGKWGSCSCGTKSSLMTNLKPCMGWNVPGWSPSSCLGGIFQSSNYVGLTDLTPY